jgi:aminoglycoside phosphotransferase (APT) family kinase protein
MGRALDGDAVAEVLATVLPAPVTVGRTEPLTGGASAETWSVDVTDGAGTTHELIVRRNSGVRGLGLDARLESLVQRAAFDAGVPVARVVATFDGGYVMARLPGEAIPRRVLRGPTAGLAGDCAAALRRIHAVGAVPGLPRLPAPEQLSLLESLHRSAGAPVPTFEVGFRWLWAHLPPPGPVTLVHGDFRMGNLLVDAGRLVAVLDWELAHLGDPMEDVGWLCTRAWRFGGPGEVGGFGSRAELAAAYGPGIDPDRVRFWEVLGSLKWGVICQLQSGAHLRGEVRSVERAAIGRRVAEAELDLLLSLEGKDA